jgi:hypothetical protein
MRFLKTYESWSIDEYIGDVRAGLSKFNLTPVNLNKLMDEYENEISDYCDSGKAPFQFVDKVVKELDLDQGGFGSDRKPLGGERQIKYL